MLTQQVLERLIIENIQQQIGDRSGIRISDEELNQAMGTIAQRNGMSLEQFQAALTRDGLSYADAREQVRREMVISRVRQRRVAERIQVSEQEVKNFPRLGHGQDPAFRRVSPGQYPDPGAGSRVLGRDPGRRKAGPGALPAAQAGRRLRPTGDFRSAGDNALEGGEIGWRKAAQLPQPFDSMIGSWPSATSPSLSAPPAASSSSSWKRSAAAARWSVTKCMSAISCSSSAKSAAKRETEKLAQKLYERIQSGEDFGELAKSFSEDPGSALNGGDLNWIDPEALVPEFRQVMNDTPQGELSSRSARSSAGTSCRSSAVAPPTAARSSASSRR